MIDTIVSSPNHLYQQQEGEPTIVLAVATRDDGVIPPYVVGGSTFGQKWG